jgi:hypothetical protein
MTMGHSLLEHRWKRWPWRRRLGAVPDLAPLRGCGEPVSAATTPIGGGGGIRCVEEGAGPIGGGGGSTASPRAAEAPVPGPAASARSPTAAVVSVTRLRGGHGGGSLHRRRRGGGEVASVVLSGLVIGFCGGEEGRRVALASDPAGLAVDLVFLVEEAQRQCPATAVAWPGSVPAEVHASHSWGHRWWARERSGKGRRRCGAKRPAPLTAAGRSSGSPLRESPRGCYCPREDETRQA